MRVLMVHQEAVFFGGAEKVLGYFLSGILETGCQMEMALVQGGPVCQVVPEGVPKIWIPGNQPFSVKSMLGQVNRLRDWVRENDVRLIHGWGARDWELCALLGLLTRRPALGTLHDHPKSSYISRKRQRLMRATANRGLAKVVAVSEPLRAACISAGYLERKMAVVHNGVPGKPPRERERTGGPLRIGFAGTFTELKGLDGFFAILSGLTAPAMAGCEVLIAGSAKDKQDEAWVGTLTRTYEGCGWWPQVRWLGWVEEMGEFLGSLDLLIVPSRMFDSLPTVLLEAALEGVPVLASRVGGTVDVVADQETGWLFAAGDWGAATRQLEGLLRNPPRLAEAGAVAARRVRERFALHNMVANYLKLYSAVGFDE